MANRVVVEETLRKRYREQSELYPGLLDTCTEDQYVRANMRAAMTNANRREDRLWVSLGGSIQYRLRDGRMQTRDKLRGHWNSWTKSTLSISDLKLLNYREVTNGA